MDTAALTEAQRAIEALDRILHPLRNAQRILQGIQEAKEHGRQALEEKEKVYKELEALKQQHAETMKAVEAERLRRLAEVEADIKRRRVELEKTLSATRKQLADIQMQVEEAKKDLAIIQRSLAQHRQVYDRERREAQEALIRYQEQIDTLRKTIKGIAESV